jgi:hypothetical protein
MSRAYRSLKFWRGAITSLREEQSRRVGWSLFEIYERRIHRIERIYSDAMAIWTASCGPHGASPKSEA